ncbi:NUDIX domain-containing protein, partial [Verrucomicrobiales bacterium]|nr:NUDIX domain-containing protein [Verrucomicrobiales bacterium]
IFQAGDKYLHYVRGAKGGEKRLASKGSLGIGGHVNDTDVDPENRAETVDKVTYTKGVEREIREELKIVGPYTQRIVALINDDSNAVGKVHLGVVHLIQLESENVKANEASIEKLEFLDVEELTKLRKKMESWSQICFDGFIGLLE